MGREEKEQEIEQGESLTEKKNLPLLLKERLTQIPKSRWYVITMVGILILLIAARIEKVEDNGGNTKGISAESGDTITVFQDTEAVGASYAAYLEGKLKTVLSMIEGVGNAEVVVTLKSSSEKIIDKEYSRRENEVEESDSAGGTRKSTEQSYEENTVLIGEDNGTPYVLQEIVPEIEGILVVAEGADSAVIEEKITDALSALFGISPHKIRVLKKG